MRSASAVSDAPSIRTKAASQPYAPSRAAAGCVENPGLRVGQQQSLRFRLVDLAHLILVPDVLDERIDFGAGLLDRSHWPRSASQVIDCIWRG